MLTFLRKIRKSLIDSGNARKYLLYAIGEIVLVVIGILIALEINNRNLDKLNRVAESKFLVKMYQDIQADTTSLLRLTNGAKTKSYFLISILNDELTEIRNVGRRKVESIFNSRSQATFSPRDNTFNEIISSGKINIIENEDLKEQIFEYYRYVEERNDVLSSKLSDWPKIVSELIPGEQSYKVRSIPGEEFDTQTEQKIIDNIRLNKDRIEETINAELGYTGVQVISYSTLLKEANYLLDSLSLEIEGQ